MIKIGRKKKETIKKTQKTKPLFVNGKLVCPGCKEQKDIKITDYGISKTKDGVLYKYLCEKCNVEFENEMKFANLSWKKEK